ncbi:MAG: sigma-70 family RNA polymerase sigma factor [Oscillospiraceae bacterium]|nr:sigma-70 family RNA polymerase sigma factor [Oscillospiraceae bacterium]
MDDKKIIDLYWRRSEAAIGETANKYARYCHSISFNILHDMEDAEECVNDTYLRAWNAMPPHRPNCLAVFLGKITRNLSLDKFRNYSAGKRGFAQTALALSELAECVSSASSIEQTMDEKELAEILNHFLKSLPKQKRVMFVQRYWYLMPIKAVAEHLGESESQVKSALLRTRNSLKSFLEQEGITL